MRDNREIVELIDDLRDVSLALDDMTVERDALRAEVARLTAELDALKHRASFARHSRDCACFDGWDCTCGLDSVTPPEGEA